jgi:hypothetical protein
MDLEAESFAAVADMDAKLLTIADPAARAQAASKFSYKRAESLHITWQKFFGELFVTFVDGYRMQLDSQNKQTGTVKINPHYSDEWKRHVVTETGSHYKVPVAAKYMDHPGVKSKMQIRALGAFARSDDLKREL